MEVLRAYNTRKGMQIDVKKKKNKSLWLEIKGEEVMSDNEKIKPKKERHVLDFLL